MPKDLFSQESFFMRLRLLAVIAGLAIATGAAQAQSQIGIYATPTFSYITNSSADTGVFAFLGENSTSRLFKGFGIGVYDDFFHTPRIDAGLDVRTSIVRGGGAQLTEFLLGGRVAFKPTSYAFKPYIDLLGGVGGTKPAHNPRSVSKGQYSVSAGVDYPLGKRVDFRVIEVGYSSLQTINSSTVNTQETALPSSRILNFSTGFVFHIK
jgi:opacity protein-like surface antigen